MVAANLDGLDAETLRTLVATVASQLNGPVVVSLFSVVDEKVVAMFACSQEAQARGIRAGDLAKLASQILGGGGGGKADFAQGGGSNPQAVDEAIAAVKSLCR